MNALADEYLAATFAPWLQEKLLRLTASSVPVLSLGGGKLEVQYPAAFSVPYVRNTILLEIGHHRPDPVLPALLRPVYAHYTWYR
jgi:hypothetical protein